MTCCPIEQDENVRFVEKRLKFLFGVGSFFEYCFKHSCVAIGILVGRIWVILGWMLYPFLLCLRTPTP